MNHFIFYRASSNWYMRLVRLHTGQVWDIAARSLSATTVWSDSAITLGYSAVIGGHPVILPNDLPDGEYDALFYNAASPADTDASQVGKRISWAGGDLLSLPQNL